MMNERRVLRTSEQEVAPYFFTMLIMPLNFWVHT